MAGNHSVPEDDPVATTGDRSKSTGKNGLLGRRALLGAAGTAIAGATLPGIGAAQSSECETLQSSGCETLEVPAGQREVVELGDGETFENVLVDVTADGAGFTIAAYGTDWTIRNVAVRGRVDMGDECVIGAADTGGGTSRIEDVWLGDGAVYERKGGTGLWVNPEHNGHLEVNRVNVQEMGDNALYCSAPGSGGGGTVAIRDCYAANCWVSHFRLAEGVVENCTAHLDDGHMDGRGVWGWSPGTVEVRGCNLNMNGRHYSFQAGANGGATSIDVTDTQYDVDYHEGIDSRNGSNVSFGENCGNDPQNVVPDTCPESLEDVLL